MSERPTPEEIVTESALAADDWGPSDMLDALAAHGYRIVHPDDVPVGDWIDWPADRNHGWNLCRAHIFGEGS